MNTSNLVLETKTKIKIQINHMKNFLVAGSAILAVFAVGSSVNLYNKLAAESISAPVQFTYQHSANLSKVLGISTVNASAANSPINPGPLPIVYKLTISPSTLPNATVGQAYSTQLQVSGGTAPYTLNFLNTTYPSACCVLGITGGTSSTGLYTFNTQTSSTIAGPAGTYTWNFQIIDALGNTVTKTITLTINPISSAPLGLNLDATSPSAPVSAGSSQSTFAIIDFTNGSTPKTITSFILGAKPGSAPVQNIHIFYGSTDLFTIPYLPPSGLQPILGTNINIPANTSVAWYIKADVLPNAPSGSTVQLGLDSLTYMDGSTTTTTGSVYGNQIAINAAPLNYNISITSPTSGSFFAGSNLNIVWNQTGTTPLSPYYFLYLKTKPDQILGGTAQNTYYPMIFRATSLTYPNFNITLPSDASGAYYLELDVTDTNAIPFASFTSNAITIINSNPITGNGSLAISLDPATPPPYVVYQPNATNVNFGDYDFKNTYSNGIAANVMTFNLSTGVPNAISNIKLVENGIIVGSASGFDSSGKVQINLLNNVVVAANTTVKLGIRADLNPSASTGLNVCLVNGIYFVNPIVGPTIKQQTANGSCGNPITVQAGTAPSLSITGTALPSAAIGQDYHASIGFAYNGLFALNATWTGLPTGIIGQGLPSDPNHVLGILPGLTNTVTLSGSPLQNGTYPVTLSMTDQFGANTTKTFNLIVGPVIHPIPLLVPPPTPSGQPGLPKNSVVEFPGNPTVYLSSNGVLQPFTSPAVFLANGFKWSDIQQLQSSQASAQTISTTPVALPNSSIVRGSGQTVYLISGGEKIGIPSLSVFYRLGLSFANLINLSDGDLQSYADGGIQQ